MPNGKTVVLASGAPIDVHLTTGEHHLYAADLDPGAWLVTVEQLGIDVVVEASPAGAPEDGDGARRVRVDLPFDRQGSETLLLEVGPDDASRFVIEVAPRDASAPGDAVVGRYRLTLERLPEDAHQRLAAERLATAAARAWAVGGPDGEHRARDLFRDAVVAWRRVGDGVAARRAATRMLHALGLAERQLGEMATAADLLGQAVERWRDLDATSLVASALNDTALSLSDLGNGPAAEPLFREARDLFHALGEITNEATVRNNLCLFDHSRGALERAGACYRETLGVLRGAPDPRLEAALHNNLGGILDRLGEPEAARREHHAALELRRRLGDLRGEAESLVNLASLDRFAGRWREAIAGWERASHLFRELGVERREAVTLNSLGVAYLDLGEPERARILLLDALVLRRSAEDRRGEAITLNHLATAHRHLGEPDAARTFRRQALDLRRALDDRRGEARLFVWLGRDALDDGQPNQALEHLDHALDLFAEVDDPRNTARAHAARGQALHALGRFDEAAGTLSDALFRQNELGDATGEIGTRVALIEVERRRGRVNEALAQTETILDAIEDLRVNVPTPELRGTFLASKRRAYELRIDLLFDLHRNTEDLAHLADALATAERARARALLDLLGRSEVDPAGKVRAAPLDEPEIRALLDPGTTLLQFALGEERSVLFWADREDLEAHLLPPRAAIEALARRAHRELVTLEVGAQEGPSNGAMFELATMLLAPVAQRLAAAPRNTRLAIAADGALHYIPFAALPWPDAAGAEPLLEHFEIVHLPSASALAATRRAPRRTMRRAAVVLADPVFSATDPRLGDISANLGMDRETDRESNFEASAVIRLDRLPATRGEAEILDALLPADELMSLLDTEARREAVLDGVLGGARLVHLATHGVLDAERPERSGLVLSRVDAEGRPRDGFLALRDIYDLELDAELVVLSGCRTALGKEVRGEGLVGLARGFLHAGAPRVMASLWRVEDRATAALMERFYAAHLEAGLRPSAALRAAQLELRSERRWRDPAHWSAFVLLGDWR